MDQPGIKKTDSDEIDVYSRKKELFYCTFCFQQRIDEAFILRLLILLEKYYPGYALYSNYNKSQKEWKEFALDKSFKRGIKEVQAFYVSAPFYYQKNNELNVALIKESFKFSFRKDSKNNDNLLLFDLYADLVTDTVYLTSTDGYYAEDQSLAAAKNRERLSTCLKSIEDFLEGKIIEYVTDYHLTPDSVYMYGIKENARHITDHMNLS